MAERSQLRRSVTAGRLSRFRGEIVLPSLLAGAAITLSVPPFGFWPLGVVGLALLFWRLEGLRLRNRILAGGIAGATLYGPSLLWATGFNLAGWIALVIVSCAFLAVACAATPPRGGRSLAFPAAIVLTEALRTIWPLGGFPMGGVPLGQAGGPLGPPARLGGYLLVTALSTVAAVAMVQLWHVVYQRVPRAAPAGPRSLSRPTAVGTWSLRSHHIVPAALSALAVVAVAIAGHLAPDGGPGIASSRVAAVQGGGSRGLSQAQVDQAIVYRAHLAASARLAVPLDLVLWPEDVIGLDGPLSRSPAQTQISDLARSLSTTLVAGVTEDVGTSRFRNQAVAWGPSGSIVDVYDKVHRVPFGEYVPARFIFRHLANLNG
ncbi:MAG: nitrilase-related carbon-nitrogen hydrolase, partial [Acidimicrobiales bacterium]